MIAKTSGPIPGANRLHAPRFRSTTRVKKAMPSGSSRPTGPLASTASAAADQKTRPARRPSMSPARNPSKADRATQISKHSVDSIWVQRAFSQNMKLVLSTKPASTAVRGSLVLRPQRMTSHSVPSAASTDGSRAVSE